jgi:hypothetical protein
MLDASLDRDARTLVALGRFPLKPALDGLALARQAARRDLTAAQKVACLRFYFDGAGIRNLYATLTRSGSHWSLLGIALAMDLKRGGDGEYRFENDCWIPSGGAIHTKLDWREPAGDWNSEIDPAVHGIVLTKRMRAAANGAAPPPPVVFHSHLPMLRLRLAGLGRMRTAVMLRSIYDSMESKYHKHRTLIGMGVRPLEYDADAAAPPSAENDYNFPWEKMVADAIEFYNSWGDALRRFPHIRLFRYEALTAHPAEAHKDLTDFWRLDVPLDCLKEAFGRITKAEMAKRIPERNIDNTSRVANREQGAALSPERAAFIRASLERRLIHDFGYGTDWPTQTL